MMTKKNQKEKFCKLIIQIETLENFLNQARKTSQKVDNGEFLEEAIIFSFEDSEEMSKFLIEVPRQLMLTDE